MREILTILKIEHVPRFLKFALVLDNFHTENFNDMPINNFYSVKLLHDVFAAVSVAVFNFSTPIPTFAALSGGRAAENQHFEPPLRVDLNKNVFI